MRESRDLAVIERRMYDTTLHEAGGPGEGVELFETGVIELGTIGLYCVCHNKINN